MFVSKTPWIILLAVWMTGATWWHVCTIKQLCADAETETAVSVDNVRKPALLIADGNRFRLALPGNLSFIKSGANANMNALRIPLDSLTAYLKANPGRILQITGQYSPAETNPTSLTNLGLARAEAVKQYFVQQGIPAASLTTNGDLRSDLAFTPDGDSLYGGVGFSFGGAATSTGLTSPVTASAAAPATEEGLAAAEKYSSVFDPIDLYFPLAKATYIKTPETVKFFDEAITYLAAHTDKKLRLIGHTDDSGSGATNLRLSRDRANQVKAGLRRSGIRQEQIEVVAKGEVGPKAPNDTREGRKANRRVTVVVQ